jgi:hypothetical protein
MDAFDGYSDNESPRLGHLEQGRSFDYQERAKTFAASKRGVAHGVGQWARCRPGVAGVKKACNLRIDRLPACL